MKFWKSKTDANERKQRINNAFRHVDADVSNGSGDSASSRSTGRSRRSSVLHFEPGTILPGITQVPVNRASYESECSGPRKSKTWHNQRYTARGSNSPRSRASSISSDESIEIEVFSETDSAPSSASDYSFEERPPRRRPMRSASPPRQRRPSPSKGRRRPKEQVVVTETYVDGKLHERKTEKYTYRDSEPSGSSISSNGSFESRPFSFDSFRERQYAQRDRPRPFPRERPRFTADDDPLSGQARFQRDFKRPPRAFPTPRDDPDIRFESREPRFKMPPRRDTSPDVKPRPRYREARPRWASPPSSADRTRQGTEYRPQPDADSSHTPPRPTTSPDGHNAPAPELPKNVTDILDELNKPRWEKASTEELCKHIFRMFPPKTEGAKTYKGQVPGILERKDLLRMVARYHPDKNVDYGEEWKLTSSEIVKHLNKRLTDWK